MGLLNQQNKGDKKKSSNKNPKNTGSKFINKGSKPAGGVVNKKGLTGGSRGSWYFYLSHVSDILSVIGNIYCH